MHTGRNTMVRRAFGSASGRVAVAMLGFVVLMAVLGATALADPAVVINTANAYLGPSAQHWLGTDELGRDQFARVAVATPLSLVLALTATAIGIVGGLVLGSISWFSGPRVAALAGSVIGIAIAFPSLLLILFAAVIFGQGVFGSVLAVGIAMMPWYARLVQNMVASIRDREYVLAALVQGQSRFIILMRYILPNVGEPLIVNATLGAAGALLSFAGLSFLGLGIQAPEYDWGLLLSENMASIYVTPLPALAAAAMIVIAGLGFNLLGESFARTLESERLVTAGVEVTPTVALDMPAGLVARITKLDIKAPRAGGDDIHIVKEFSLDIRSGRIIGIVGESGSGKTLAAQAIAQVADESLKVTATTLTLDGVSYAGVAASDDPRLVQAVGYVFQDSSSSFNPVMRLDKQIPEALEVRDRIGKRRGHDLTVEQLEKVGVPDAASRATQYPHQFSGGMRQRAMIAQATVAVPRLVIADEPTTALDVSLKARILGLLGDLRDRDSATVIIISHDISALLSVVDDIVVMYGGRVVESGPAEEISRAPQHPYTRALLEAVPAMDSPLDEPLKTIPGRPVDFSVPVAGCAFADRCEFAMPQCSTTLPILKPGVTGTDVACHLQDVDVLHEVKEEAAV